MSNKKQARLNMVESQIKPNGVYFETILDAFTRVPREIFLPEDKKEKAYIDEDILLSSGSFMMEPMVHARMLQALEPQPDDVVLVVNDCTGYASALLSELVSTVVTLETNMIAREHIKKHWDQLDCNNIAVFEGTSESGDSEHGPYNLIFIHGAVADVPKSLLDQLTIGGRLITNHRQTPQDFGSVLLIKRISETDFSRQRIFDSATLYVKGLEPASDFQF